MHGPFAERKATFFLLVAFWEGQSFADLFEGVADFVLRGF